MPDLQPVFDDLRRRLAAHEDVFGATDNLTDANASGGSKVDQPSPDTYVLLGAPTARYPDGQYFAGVTLDLTRRGREQFAREGLLAR